MRVILPGSYDPISLGHLNIIERCSRLFDEVFVVVGINSDKKYMFSDHQRVELAKKASEHIKNVKVVFNEGYTVDKAIELEAYTIVKGIRNQNDLIYEYEQMKINKSLNPNIKTIFLKADPRFDNISSTLIRNNIIENKDITNLVPSSIIELIDEYKKSNL